MSLDDQDIFTKVNKLAHNPLTPVEPQLSLYIRRFPQIADFLNHWTSFEYPASVLDGVRALQKFQSDKPDSYIEVARSLLSASLIRHGLAEIKLNIGIRELSGSASNFAQVRHEFDETNNILHVLIEHQPNQNKKEDFMPLMLLHELRYVYQGMILKVPYQSQDDSPHEIDARAYQEIGYQVSKWMQSNVKLLWMQSNVKSLDVIFYFAYDYAPYKPEDYLSKDVDRFCSESFVSILSFFQNQTSSPEVIWARIFHILHLRLQMNKAIAQCMLLVQQKPLPMEEIVQARSYLLEKFSPDDPLSNSQDKQLQSAWHESLSYIHNRLGVIIESGQQSDSVSAVKMYRMAASDALNAIKTFPYSRYAKYLAQNIAEIARLLNSNKILLTSDEIYTKWYGFWHIEMFQDWLIKNSRRFSSDSSVELNISEFRSKELSKAPPYYTNRKYGVDLVKEYGISCSLMRDMVTASVLQYQLNPSSKISISHSWTIRYLVLHKKELANETNTSPSEFHSNLHGLAFEALIPSSRVNELVMLAHNLDKQITNLLTGSGSNESKKDAEPSQKIDRIERVSRPSVKLRYESTGKNSVGSSSQRTNNESNETRDSRSLNAFEKTNAKQRKKWVIPGTILTVVIIFISISFLPTHRTLNNSSSESSSKYLPNDNQTLEGSFPKPNCGDPRPDDPGAYPVSFYPVYIDFTESNLRTIKSNFCTNAFSRIRLSTGERVIQVASFTNIDRANSLSDLMMKRFGSGEVGQPTVIPSKN